MKGAFDCVFYLNFTLKKKSVFSSGTVKKGYFYVDRPFFPDFLWKEVDKNQHKGKIITDW